MEKKLPLYKLVTSDEAEGVTANAFVEDPANGFAFLAFNKQSEVAPLAMAADKMKRNVTGVLLAPEQRIYRRNEQFGEHQVYFTADNIEQIVKRFSKNLRFRNVNLEHAVPVEGVTMIESWITGEGDKAKSLGFDVPQGTWMATFHVEDEAIWNNVLNGTYKGFSIEGLFGMELQMAAQDVPQDVVPQPELTIEQFLETMHSDTISDADKMKYLADILFKDAL